MLWRSPSLRDLAQRAEIFRRTHERWLDHAVRTGAEVPRIPVRRMDEGGFDELMSRARGREAARRWWERAFGRVRDAG